MRTRCVVVRRTRASGPRRSPPARSLQHAACRENHSSHWQPIPRAVSRPSQTRLSCSLSARRAPRRPAKTTMLVELNHRGRHEARGTRPRRRYTTPYNNVTAPLTRTAIRYFSRPADRGAGHVRSLSSETNASTQLGPRAASVPPVHIGEIPHGGH